MTPEQKADAEINYSAIFSISNEVFSKKASEVLNVPLGIEVRRNIMSGPSWGKLCVYVYDENDTENGHKAHQLYLENIKAQSLAAKNMDVKPNLIERLSANAERYLLTPIDAQKVLLAFVTLRKISDWQMPETGEFWNDDPQKPMSYAACWGSNGERDYVKGIAQAAIYAAEERSEVVYVFSSVKPSSDDEAAAIAQHGRQSITFWNDDNAFDFVNWFLRVHELDFRYTLENRALMESFKNGDDASKWHGIAQSNDEAFEALKREIEAEANEEEKVIKENASFILDALNHYWHDANNNLARENLGDLIREMGIKI